MDVDSQSLKAIDYFGKLSREAKELYLKNKKGKTDIDPEKFVCIKTKWDYFNFNKYKNSLNLASNIYRDKSLLKDAKNEQNETKILLNKLRNYTPTKAKKIKAKKETLSAIEKLLNNRQEVIDVLRQVFFRTKLDFKKKNQKKNQKKYQKMNLKNLSKILRINETMICLNIILIL